MCIFSKIMGMRSVTPKNKGCRPVPPCFTTLTASILIKLYFLPFSFFLFFSLLAGLYLPKGSVGVVRRPGQNV